MKLVAGESIVTLEKVNEEWLKGRIGTREGMFPVAFVEVITELPTSPAPPSPQKTTQQTSAASRDSKSHERWVLLLARFVHLYHCLARQLQL